ncbi:SAM-dependent methyltransferase [Embleya sp. NBC_00896]|uniref:SAM-dependent methyltransferase n=1 Tax=Embleya sp. NBC_00896 TaxID=2975961 RepID=UPI0038683887|nr:SAM-dependent methyltransferase [Embleya sp. NBC_00896]
MTDARPDAASESHPDSSSDDWAPTGIDVTTPSIARVYDAVLGGKDNYPADRAVAEQMLQVMPGGRDGAWEGRNFLARGVRAMAEQGIRQFLDLGSGLPTVQNTHEVAQAAAPGARTVYVDIDPIVLAHGRAILAGDEFTSVVTADLGAPAELLASPGVRDLIDLSQPVGLILLNVTHHIVDDAAVAKIVDAYKAATVPGSGLLLAQFCRSTEPELAALEQVALKALGSGRFRTMAEIEAFFDGWEIAEPGIDYMAKWRPETPLTGDLTIAQKVAGGGLAFKR